MIEVKLEPCPFCGETREENGESTFGLSLGRTRVWWVSCLTCGGVDGPVAKTRKGAVVAWNTRAPHPSHAAVEAMAQALEKARPILESELQSMCESYCPPCKEGDVFDYSKLKQPELGWITATEEALDNTDAALDAYRATQNKEKSK